MIIKLHAPESRIALVVALIASSFLATVPETAQARTRQKKDAMSAAQSPKENLNPGAKLIWDAWYTVSVGKGVHYGYYNDRVELKQNRVYYQNKFWKKEEGFINEEQLGAVAEATPDLAPVFFNFHSTYRAAETSIDGSVSEGTLLTVKIRKADQELPAIHKEIPHKVIFSTLFPIWLKEHLNELKVGHWTSFSTIMEDNLDLAYSTVHGNVRLEKADEFSGKTHSTKVTVKQDERPSIWYLDSKGSPVRIEMPDQHTIVERVPESQARHFLSVSDAGGSQ